MKIKPIYFNVQLKVDPQVRTVPFCEQGRNLLLLFEFKFIHIYLIWHYSTSRSKLSQACGANMQSLSWLLFC